MKRSAIEEAGNRYGRLVVVERAANDKRGEARWMCRCDCGGKTVARGGSLRSGHTQSCGCLRREHAAAANTARALQKGEAALNMLFSGMRRSARKRGYAWRLTKEQVRVLTKQNCFYCGVEPAQTSRSPQYNGMYTYNGLDRIDNTRGYLIENVIPCCGCCNVAKNNLTLEEFHAWVRRIYAHFGALAKPGGSRENQNEPISTTPITYHGRV